MATMFRLCLQPSSGKLVLKYSLYFNNFLLCYRRKYMYLCVETQQNGIH